MACVGGADLDMMVQNGSSKLTAKDKIFFWLYYSLIAIMFILFLWIFHYQEQVRIQNDTMVPPILSPTVRPK